MAEAAPRLEPSALDEEVAAILDLAREKEPRAYPVLHVLISSGKRRGEALGLQWRDVDWSRHKIHGGDYIRFEGDTSHSISSEEGCLLFVTASLHDRALEPSPSAGA